MLEGRLCRLNRKHLEHFSSPCYELVLTWDENCRRLPVEPVVRSYDYAIGDLRGITVGFKGWR